ncbi:hypothetical protein BDR22DRAFT_978232 [Usnea florida]
MDVRWTGIFNVLMARLNASMYEYDYTSEQIITIILLVSKVVYTDKLVKAPYGFSMSNISGLTTDNTTQKELLDTPKYKLDIAFKRLIPASMDHKLYDRLVPIPHDLPTESSPTDNLASEDSSTQQEEHVDISSVTPSGALGYNHQSTLDLITQANPEISLSKGIQLYRDKDNRYLVSIDRREPDLEASSTATREPDLEASSTATIQQDINIFTRDGLHEA